MSGSGAPTDGADGEPEGIGVVLSSLDEDQRDAATAANGPVLVLAGAGSGKTRVFAARVGVLMSRDRIPASRILAITFTNRARDEMRTRLRALYADAARGVSVLTFNALGFRLIRDTPAIAGFAPGSRLEVADSATCRSIIAELLADRSEELRIAGDAVDDAAGSLAHRIERDPGEAPSIEKLSQSVSLAISGLKESGVTPERAPVVAAALRALVEDGTPPQNLRDDERHGATRLLGSEGSGVFVVLALMQPFQQALRRRGLVDFADMLLWPLRALREERGFRRRVARGLGAVLVDEFQDTSAGQLEFLALLCSEQAHPFAVGDDRQAIYGFRGGEPGNISAFLETFPGAASVLLETNYRSAQPIVEAASALIACGAGQTRRRRAIAASQDTAEPVKIVSCLSPEHEARVAFDMALAGDSGMSSPAGSGGPEQQTFILVRAGWQTRLLELQALRRGCPYHIHGEKPFVERREVRDGLAYLDILEHGAHAERESWARVANLPARGLGKATLNRLAALSPASVTPGTSEAKADAGDCFFLELPDEALPAPARRGVGAWRSMRAAWRDGDDLADIMRDAGYEKVLSASEDGGTRGLQTRMANIDQLQDALEDAAQRGLTFQDFLLELERAAAMDREDAKLVIMTGHAAKGLEAPRVICVGWVDGILPSKRSLAEHGLGEGMTGDAGGLEEERRVAYVMMTRARKELAILTWDVPSRFISDLPQQWVETCTADDVES